MEFTTSLVSLQVGPWVILPERIMLRELSICEGKARYLEKRFTSLQKNME